MSPSIYELILTTARVHRIPVTPELFERCEYELERSAPDNDSVIDALERAIRPFMPVVAC